MGQFEKPFLFYFINPDTGQYYYVDTDDLVQTTATATPITDSIWNAPQAPEGWQDTEFTWTRSTIYWGLHRNLTTNFKFHQNAAKILRSLYFAAGSNAKCTLLIKWLNTDADSFGYEDFYTGDLDFFKCTPTYYGFEIPVKEKGLRDLFTQNERVVYEIPIPDTVKGALYGFQLQGKINYLGIAQDYVEDDGINLFPPLIETATEGGFLIGLSQTVPPFETGNPDPLNWFFKSSRTQTITVTTAGHANAAWEPVSGVTVITDPATIQLYIEVYADDASFAPIDSGTLIYNAQTGLDNVVTYQLANSFTFTVVEGNVLRLRAFAGYSGAAYTNEPFGFSTFDDLRITISSVFSQPLSFSNVLTEAEYATQMVAAMTDGLYPLDDSFLTSATDIANSCPAKTVYTSGDAIRNVKDDEGDPIDYKLKSTPFDLFSNIMKDWGAGVGIEDDTVVIQRREYFLNKDVEIVDLGEVKDFSAPVAEEFIYNYIEAGNREQEYDGLNGKDEFMNTSKFKTALTNPAPLDLVREYRHDPYGIETARYDLFQKDTTDNEVDNDIFSWEIDPSTVLTVDGVSGYGLRRDQNLPGNFAIGILFPKYKYNISKSPKRVMARNASLIKAALYYVLDQLLPIKFQSTEKNSELASTINGVTLVEKNDIYPHNTSVFEDTDPLFIPTLFKFTSKIPINLLAILNATPNGYISFSYNGVQLKGFPMKVGTKPARNQEYTCELLCHPGVDVDDINLALGG